MRSIPRNCATVSWNVFGTSVHLFAIFATVLLKKYTFKFKSTKAPSSLYLRMRYYYLNKHSQLQKYTYETWVFVYHVLLCTAVRKLQNIQNATHKHEGKARKHIQHVPV